MGALNVAHVDLYRSKLRERERRKQVARDHNLITDYFKENPVFGDKKSNGAQSKKKNLKDPVIERLKILSEFQSVKEQDVKARIKDLMRMRKNGIAKHSDSQEFEIQR